MGQVMLPRGSTARTGRLSVKVGDLVRNLNSESGLMGIIVGWENINRVSNTIAPMVAWQDGRVSWIVAHRVEVVSESRRLS